MFPVIRAYLRPTLAVLLFVLTSTVVVAGARYLRYRQEMIDWDTVSIQERFGGTAEEDRLTQIQFIKEWEYRALKQTTDGKPVWLHVTLSKRHCGNLLLVDQSQQALIRPFHLRYPDGLPPRSGAVGCDGLPTSRER